MKDRIQNAFARASEENRAALVCYICAGDPDLETTEQLIVQMAEAGADILEVGVPFSDPTADGIAIQQASERALAKGTHLTGVLETIERARKSTEIPIVLFGYANPLVALGWEAVAQRAAEAGVDGFLVVDLPVEHSTPLRNALAQHDLAFVPLVAPTSTEDRIRAASEAATGFVYYVSVTGVTGAKTELGEAAKRAGKLSTDLSVSVALGFGVKTPDDVRLVAQHADAVVVGSAIVRKIEKASSGENAIRDVKEFVAELRAATAKE